MTIEYALNHFVLFEQWVQQKMITGRGVGQPGLANDCPLCHYIKEVTGKEIYIGLDENHRGMWWFSETEEEAKLLPANFEYLRKRIDECITINAERLFVFISDTRETLSA